MEKESSKNAFANRVQELEENLSIRQHEMESQQRHHKEMLADLRLTQDALKQSDKELDEAKKRCQELEQKRR